MVDNRQTLFDKTFKDADSKWAIGQLPNIPIILWAVATGLSKLVSSNRPHRVLEAVAFGAIFTWAWLEIFHGKNYFRRGLGVVIIILSVLAAAARFK